MDHTSQKPVALRTFTAGQAARVTRLPYHLVDYWAKTGLLVPSVPAQGSNTVRVYSFTDLVAMSVAARLREAGVGTRELRKVVNYLRRKPATEHPLAGPYLLVPHDGDVCLATEKAVVSALKNPGQVYLVCAIGEIIDKLAHDAKILKPPTRGRAKVAVA